MLNIQFFGKENNYIFLKKLRDVVASIYLLIRTYINFDTFINLIRWLLGH